MPVLDEGDGRWLYVSFIDSDLTALIGYDFRLPDAINTARRNGFFRHEYAHLLKAR